MEFTIFRRWNAFLKKYGAIGVIVSVNQLFYAPITCDIVVKNEFFVFDPFQFECFRFRAVSHAYVNIVSVIARFALPNNETATPI